MIATVIKKSASKDKTNGIYLITFNLILTDNSVEVINQDFTQSHNSSNNITIARDEVMKKMQDVIDKYKENKNIYNSTVLDNTVTYINTNLVV